MDSYKLNIADYRSATKHLSIWQHGIYRLLLDQYYAKNGKYLHSGADFLKASGINIKGDDEMEAAYNILTEYFEPTEDGWARKQCDAEIAAFGKKRQEKARDRWLV